MDDTKKIYDELFEHAMLQGRRYRSEWAKITYSQLSLTSKHLALKQSKVGQKEYRLGRKAFKESLNGRY